MIYGISATLTVLLAAAGMRGRLPPPLLPLMPALALIAVLLTAVRFLGEELQRGADEASAQFWIESSRHVGIETLSIMSLSLIVGGALARRPVGDRTDKAARPEIAIRLGLSAGWWLLVVGWMVVAGNAIGRGFSDVVIRGDYLTAGAVPALKSASGPLLPIAAMLFGAVASLAVESGQRRAAVAGIGALFLLGLSAGSRFISLLPLLLLIPRLLGLPHRGRGRVKGPVLALVSATYLLGVAVYCRQLPQHGLAAYIPALVRDPLGPVVESLPVALNSLLSPVPITGATVQIGTYWPERAFAASLSPLSTEVVGYADLAPLLRLHPFIPFSAAGELAAVGIPALVGFFLVGGWLAGTLSTQLRNAGIPHSLSLGIPAALTALFVVISMQYNLRSASRYVYLFMALCLMAWAAAAVRARLREQVNSVKMELD
jgi:hypothetical protein